MDIIIDGVQVDVELQNENKVSEVISGITDWLNSHGRIVTETRLNDQVIDEAESEGLAPESGSRLSFETASFNGVMEANLISLSKMLEEIAAAISGGSSAISEDYNIEQVLNIIETYLAPRELPILKRQLIEFSQGDSEKIRPALIHSLTAFRLRATERAMEFREPDAELKKTGVVLKRIFDGIETIPVNLQTGKAAEALQEITLFTEAVDKFNRLLPLLTGRPEEGWTIGELKEAEFMNELYPILQELAGGFDGDDRILIGDLMEYEIAPRIEIMIEFIDSL